MKKLTIAPPVIGVFLAACGGGSDPPPTNNSTALISTYIANADDADKASVDAAYQALQRQYNGGGAAVGELPGVIDQTVQSFLNNVVNYVTNVNMTTPITKSDVVGLLQQQEQMDLEWFANESQCGAPQSTICQWGEAATNPTIKNLYANAIAQIEAL